MATSGQHSWSLTVGDLVDEAAERSGLDPAKLSERHLVSARRSLNLLHTELELLQIDAPWRLERMQFVLGSGLRGYVLPAGTIDILDVTVTADGTTWLPVERTTRKDYSYASDKSSTADVPTEYWVNQQTPADIPYLDGGSTNMSAIGAEIGTPAATTQASVRQPMMIFRPRPAASVTVSAYRMRTMEDAVFLGDDMDVDRTWSEAVCAGLAMKMAQKFMPGRFQELKAEFAETVGLTKQNSTDRGSIVIGGRGFGRPRQWRM